MRTIAILNNGGFRTEFYKGTISELDFDNMFPFNNNLIEIKVTGL
jgi:2',3'-cyclic-nucleotide 2'-phosphodiesterase (5'-nucleotidase family)